MLSKRQEKKSRLIFAHHGIFWHFKEKTIQTHIFMAFEKNVNSVGIYRTGNQWILVIFIVELGFLQRSSVRVIQLLIVVQWYSNSLFPLRNTEKKCEPLYATFTIKLQRVCVEFLGFFLRLGLNVQDITFHLDSDVYFIFIY